MWCFVSRLRAPVGGGLTWGDEEFCLRQAIPSPREGGDTGKALHGAQQSRGAWGPSHHGWSDSWFSCPLPRLPCTVLASLTALLGDFPPSQPGTQRAPGRSLTVWLFMVPIYSAEEISPQPWWCPGMNHDVHGVEKMQQVSRCGWDPRVFIHKEIFQFY